MKEKLFYIASILTLLCCSSHPDQVCIQGSFAHLEQGEFYIYSTDGGINGMDTLHIAEGEFQYNLPLDREATLFLLYPNHSQLPLFEKPGDDIRVKGDVQSLNEVEVNGTKSNELYTKFRKGTRDLPDKEARETAKKFLLEAPTEAASKYIFRQHFLANDSTTHEEVKEIYDSLCRANPEDINTIRLAGEVRSHGILHPGRKLPSFEIESRAENDTTNLPDTLSNKDYEGKHVLFVFWASWKSGSQYALTRGKKLQKNMKDELYLISYSLDIDKRLLEFREEKDSLLHNKTASTCDFLCWDSPLVRKWGIKKLPYFILTGPDGTIIASGSDWQLDIEPKANKLCL